ncbi:MAG: LamG domain-containing protein, partial [Trebonia sp.]
MTVMLPEPASRWALNDGDAAHTAADIIGAHTATGSNIAWCAAAVNGNCATFGGTDSDFTTSGPVLNTAPGSSFTVSAAVDLSKAGGFQTIVSQDGTHDSGFYLQYVGATNNWAFSRVTGDTNAGPAGIRALSTTAVPALNTWTELVGVFDASDNQLRLYVNGVLQGTATDPSPFGTSGDLAIGRAQFDSAPTDWFDGAANQIEVWNVALTTAQ